MEQMKKTQQAIEFYKAGDLRRALRIAKDFRLGLNAAQTTLAAVAGLVGATLKN